MCIWVCAPNLYIFVHVACTLVYFVNGKVGGGGAMGGYGRVRGVWGMHSWIVRYELNG